MSTRRVGPKSQLAFRFWYVPPDQRHLGPWLRQLPGGAVPLLQREEDKQEAFEAIRSLIDQIILSPEESKLRVDLHGEIAAILKLAQAGKNPARGLADRAEQLVMVAGTGFEPVTFRL